ncbi:MAG: MFS transporter [Solirubrobacteraceae bacterium]
MLKSSSSRRRFFAAHLQSQLGSGAGYVALVLIAYQRLHSGWAIALVLLADFLPGILLAAPFGALADRYPRLRLAVVADVLRAGAFIGLAFVPSIGATLVLALVAGVGSALFKPAVAAALPELVDAEQRSAATALFGGVFSFGMTAGPAIAGLLLFVASPTEILAINGATFLMSATLLAGVPLGRGDGDGADDGSLWSATRQGARAAAELPGVAALLVIGAFSVLAAAVMNVAEPLLATGPLAAGKSGYSLLVAVYGAGMVVGSIINTRMGSDVGNLRSRLLVGLALNGVGMVASAIAPSVGWAIGSFLLTGISNSLIVGPEARLFQELVAERMLGRVFGLQSMLTDIAYVVAFLGAGLLLATLGVRSVFALGGSLLLALTVAGWLGFHPSRATETFPGALPETS